MHICWFVLLILSFSGIAVAETITGTVNRSHIGRALKVSITKGDSILPLCPSEITRKVSYLNRMRLSVEGQRQKDSSCFLIKDFKILSFPSGNRAVTGVLRKTARYYVLETKDTSYPIPYPTEGVLEYLNRRVVLELNAVTNDSGELRYRIASYMGDPLAAD